MQRKTVRQRTLETKKHKYPIGTIAFTIFLWLSLLFLIYFIDPETLGVVPFFIFIFFLATYFTFKRLSLSIALTLFLILEYLKIGNIINFLLLLGTAIAYEYYIKKSN